MNYAAAALPRPRSRPGVSRRKRPRDLLRTEYRGYRPVAIVGLGLHRAPRRPVLKAADSGPTARPRKIVPIVQRRKPIRADENARLKIINNHRLHPNRERRVAVITATPAGKVRGVRGGDASNSEQNCTRKSAAHRTSRTRRNSLQFIRSLSGAGRNRPVTLILGPAILGPAILGPASSISPQNMPVVQLTVMPRRPTPFRPAARPTFRQRYDELEERRAELSARLQSLGEAAQRHPGYKRALKLLNDIYRREKLPQRLAVLQAAAWLIDVLEKLVSSG
jgi:hypothetical protein